MLHSSQRDNSNEYHKRANFPENIEFSGISLYSDKSIRHHKNTRNFNGKSDTKKQLEKRPKRSIKSRVFGTFIVLVIDNNKSTKT